MPAPEAMLAADPRLERLRGAWPDDVDVWRIPVDLARTPHAAGLDAAEAARLRAYRSRAEACRFSTARRALRRLLGTMLACEPLELRFVVDERGRPLLRDFPWLRFNVSHAGSQALIATSTRRAVGVDIERIDPSLDWQELSAWVCSAQEIGSLTGRRDFYRCWVRKEACLKARGVGIVDGMRGIDHRVDRDTSGLALCDLAERDGHLGALAYDALLRDNVGTGTV